MAKTAWDNRDSLDAPKSVQEKAIELISERLSELASEYCRNSYQSDDTREELARNLAEVQLFANKHEIPFNVDVSLGLIKNLATDNADIWQNSSVNC